MSLHTDSTDSVCVYTLYEVLHENWQTICRDGADTPITYYLNESELLNVDVRIINRIASSFQ